MERILVTGAGGFVGSYLAEDLQCHGYGVTGLVRGNFIPAKKTYPVVSADLAEAVDVEWNGDIIVHAAGRVPSAGVSAGEYKRDNIDAMERLLKIAARKKVSLIIYLSTMDIYGRKNTEKILDENTEKILDENTEYGISKYYAERLLQENGRVNYVILRVPGVFGRGMSNTWLARAINNMAQDNAVEVYSAGFANNNFIAIEDLAKFIRTIISRSIYNDVFVLGNEEKIRIIDMMNILKAEMRSKSEIVVRENRIIPFSIIVSHALANGFSSVNFQTMVKNFFQKDIQ